MIVICQFMVMHDDASLVVVCSGVQLWDLHRLVIT